MNNRFLTIACLLFVFLPPLHADETLLSEQSLAHGIGVIKRITNKTRKEILVRFADMAFPPIKPLGSTDDFKLEDKPKKLISIFGSTMMLGIVGIMAMKSSPQDKLANMQQRINKAGTSFAGKVDAERERLTSLEKGEDSEEQDPAAAKSDLLKSRAEAEKKWTDFIEKQRKQEDEEHEKKRAELSEKKRNPALSSAEKKQIEEDEKILEKQASKRAEDRKKANEYQQRLGKSQREGGYKNILWSDRQNTKNEWFNEKQISREK